ncbi:cytochrome P450 [Lentzea flava]|uniref:Cytochrome P450 n=1 Tax=Lentzea flava TaxID=103732 RepID=A0ABQ2ULK9_9PSEU|nr:cytochrome P450 [Lentzea flava]MCP2200569.1 Cytochrome P450 [Lentzea flava]GGU43604.1 cytochrome P450 [Lentzea flava]
MTAYKSLAAFGVVGAAAFAHWRWSKKPIRTPEGTVHPPLAAAGLDGVPGIGLLARLHSLITDPIGLIERNARVHGDMFTLRAPMIYDITFLLDRDAYAMVMNLPADHAAIGPVLSRVPTVGYWFPRSRRDPESLQQLVVAGRRLMAEMLPQHKVRTLPNRITGITTRHMSEWGPTTDMTEVLHLVVYEVVGRYFMGDTIWTAIGDELSRLYRTIADGVDVMRAALSITPLHQFMPEYRATTQLFQLLRSELSGFRSADSPLLGAIDRLRIDGEPLDEADILWMFMYVLWNAMAYPGTYAYWSLVDVLTTPGVRNRVTELDDRAARQEVLGRCVLETIRLNPVSTLVRYLYKPLEFTRNGTIYHIPAGQAVGVFPRGLNRDQRYVPDAPESYDPDRFVRVPALRTTSFGRGPFGCIAQDFSKIVLSSVLNDVLTRFDIVLLDQPANRRCRVHQNYPDTPLTVRLMPRDLGSSAGFRPL